MKLSRPLPLLLLSALLLSSGAAATPLVFDFESGLQGWEAGTPRRVSGSPLGGDFAIFGEGSTGSVDIGTGPFLRMSLDLSAYSALTWSQLTVVGDASANFLAVAIRPVGAPPTFVSLIGGVSLLATPADPNPNPDLRFVDLSAFEGLHSVTFLWTTVNLTPLSGFVDDITFVPVIPEPTAALLFGAGLLLVAPRLRRR